MFRPRAAYQVLSRTPLRDLSNTPLSANKLGKLDTDSYNLLHTTQYAFLRPCEADRRVSRAPLRDFSNTSLSNTKRYEHSHTRD